MSYSIDRSEVTKKMIIILLFAACIAGAFQYLVSQTNSIPVDFPYIIGNLTIALTAFLYLFYALWDSGGKERKFREHIVMFTCGIIWLFFFSFFTSSELRGVFQYAAGIFWYAPQIIIWHIATKQASKVLIENQK